MPKAKEFAKSNLHECGFARLLLLVLIAVIALAVFFVVNNLLPSQQTPTSDVTVDLKSEYENPFDKNTQYVNPFSEYKNPFDNL